MKTKSFAIGSRVKFSGAFLRNTGMQRGSAGLDKWTVTQCACDLCATGRFIATNEPLDTTSGYEDQSPEWRANAKRHIAAANLMACK